MTSPRLSLILLAGVCLLAPSLRAAEAEDPNVAQLAKMRDTLRKTMLDLRTAQTDLATAQAGQAAAEAKNKEITAELATNSKELAATKVELEKKKEEIVIKDDEYQRNMTQAKEIITKWTAGYGKAVEVANAKEAERAKLADENSVLKATVRDRKSQNLELFRLANEILTRYQNFSVGDALKAREPFTQVTRARLDAQVQDYRDKVEDLRIKEDPAKKPQDSSKKPKTPASTH